MKNKYQDKFGYPVDRTKGKVKPAMAAWIQEFIRHSPFCVLATSNLNGDCDASPKGGRSELPDVRLEVHNPDEKAEILQGLLLNVDEACSHCPMALKFSRLWDVDEITQNVAKPPVGVKEPGI